MLNVLVWNKKWSKILFSVYKINGLWNIEVILEFVIKLGLIYGMFVVRSGIYFNIKR